MNPRERALSFWRHGGGVNSDELRDLVAEYMPTFVDDANVPVEMLNGGEFAGSRIVQSFAEQDVENIKIGNYLNDILDELKAIHKELQDGG